MPLSDLTASAVNMAISEFDKLGRLAFLKKYGFGPARGYFLEKNGTQYDSKAVAGAAHGYLPDQKPLSANEFSGGAATVQRVLQELGFNVLSPRLPSPGEVLGNEQISVRFAVGNMGGMRRSKENNLLVLISDPFKGLYRDRWEDDVLHYTGMGRIGDQSLDNAQNLTLSESPRSRMPIHLLEALQEQKYTYAGEVELIEHPYQEDQIDDEGHWRKVWMFPIRLKPGGIIPNLSESEARDIEESQSKRARQLSTAELKARAQKARMAPSKRGAQSTIFVRDAAIAEYVKRLAKGACDLCRNPAPFLNKSNEAYLECHHIIWLAKGGEDSLENTVALCPNCHRRMHVLDRNADKEQLINRVAKREL
jgi:5-methylcytosine-specific restriction protein A